MQAIEVTGETVEEAIESGLKQLGVASDDVMVTVLDEPSRGLFGIGAKPARVRLVVFRPSSPPAPASAPSVTSTPAKSTPTPTPTPAPSAKATPAPAKQDIDLDDDNDDALIKHYETIADEDADEDALVGKEVLTEMLRLMSIEGLVEIRRADPTGPEEQLHWILNVKGNKLSRLIGRRGETLASLQYLVRLIVSRRLQRRANIIVDVGDYKQNRSSRLRQMANRLADQAIEEGRMMSLEPMPPHERRIIHLSLRNRKDVSTRSVGDGRGRKVTIVPN
ncbi:hypothetical protein MASR2M15_23260 [Anaerolineales bacterium]